ncbi:hypothetical protein EBT16_00555 [bacterium]|nr:hypothetical protein [bacterium]
MAKKTAKKTAKPTLAQRIAQNKKDAERAKNIISRNGQKLFKEAVKEIFKEFKNLEKFQWNQYTPNWNDGDPCDFGLYTDSLAINDECGKDYDEIESTWNLEHLHKLLSDKENEKKRILKEIKEKAGNSWEVESLKRDLKSIKNREPKEVEGKFKIKKTITYVLENIDESVFERMFGEGTVTVTRDGITVEECEHD